MSRIGNAAWKDHPGWARTWNGSLGAPGKEIVKISKFGGQHICLENLILFLYTFATSAPKFQKDSKNHKIIKIAYLGRPPAGQPPPARPAASRPAAGRPVSRQLVATKFKVRNVPAGDPLGNPRAAILTFFHSVLFPEPM